MLSKGSRFWLGTLVLAAVVGGVALLLSERRSVESLALPAFDLQAHRGGRGLMPENTLPAFAHALSLGVTTLELDVGMTSDGVVVVHHDRRLSPEHTRGPDGTWIAAPGLLLRGLTLAQLQEAEVGRVHPESRSAQRFPGQQGLDGVRVPTLGAVIAAAEAQTGGRVFYNVETKLSPLAPEETETPEAMAAAVVHVLAEQGVLARASLQSFDWRSLQAAQQQAPALATTYLTAEREWLDNVARGQDGTSPWAAGFDVDDHAGSLPRTIKAAGGATWSPYHKDLGEAELREAQALGLRVIVWTVNEASDMSRLIDLGVDGIITDYPDRLRAVLQDKGRDLPPAYPRKPG